MKGERMWGVICKIIIMNKCEENMEKWFNEWVLVYKEFLDMFK